MENKVKLKDKDSAEDLDLEKKNWKPYATEYNPIKIGSINGIGTFPHDKGIIRAMESTYKPNSKVPKQEYLKKTLFISKLGPLVSEADVESIFLRYGKVKSVQIVRDIVTKRSKGYGFVEFAKERHFDRAYRDPEKLILAGECLIVDKTASKSMSGWKPRRLGGGFGGNKDSGQLRFGCKARPWLRPLFKSERRLKKS